MKAIFTFLLVCLCLNINANPDKVLPVSKPLILEIPAPTEDEAMDAMKNALDAFLGKGKYIIDQIDQEKQSDGSTRLSATINVFRQSGIKLSGVYKGKKVTAVELVFPKEATINFTNINQLSGNKLSDFLPSGFPVRAGIWVKNLAADFDTSSMIIPQKMKAVIATPSAWPLIGVGSFSAKDVELDFEIENPTKASRTISGTITANAYLGKIGMEILSTLSNNIKETAITAKVNNVNLKNVFDAVIGAQAPSLLNQTPDLFKKLNLNNAEFSILPIKKELSVKANTSMGGVILKLSRSSGPQKVLFALRPPAGFKFSELSGILAPMDKMDMSGSFFVISNKQDVISNKFLDPSSNSEAQFAVKRGLNLVTAISLPKEMQDMLKVKDISLVGALAPDFTGIDLSAELGLKLELGNGAFSFDALGAGLKLNKTDVELRLEGAGSFATGGDRVQIYGGLFLSATAQVIELEAGLAAGDRRAERPANCLLDQPEWNEPFDVPGVAIRAMGIRGGVGAKFPWINTVGIQGKAKIGAVKDGSKHICGGLTTYVSLADPTESMLIAEVHNLKPISFIEAFVENVEIQGVLRNALNTGIEQAKLKIVPKEMTLFGQTYSPGIALDSMKMSLAGINGLIGFSFGETGIKAYGNMDPYVLKQGGVTFFGIKGARNNPNGRITGPTISLGLDAADPHFKLNGNINLLGIEREAFIQVNKNGFEFETTGKILNGALGVTAHVKASKLTPTSGPYAKVAFENKLQTMVADKLVQFIKDETKKNQKAYRDAQKVLSDTRTNNDFEQFWVDAANETVGAFKEMDRGAAIAGTYVVNGLLKDAINVRKLSFEGEVTSIKGKVEVEVDMTIAGQKLTEKVMAELTLSEDAFTDLIVDAIGNEVVDFFGQLDNQVADAFDDLGGELETAFEDLGNEIIKGAEVVGEGVIDAAEFIGNGIIDGFNAIDNFFQGSTSSPPVSNGTYRGIPVDHTHFRIKVNSITVTDDEGGFTPALELFGSIAVTPSGNIKYNGGATPFLYSRAARYNKEVKVNQSISVGNYLDFYVSNANIQIGSEFILLISKMSEWNDSEANQENLSGLAHLFLNAGTTTISNSFLATDGDGETISISYSLQKIGSRGPIPTPQQMMAAVKSGNANEINRLVQEGGKLRGKGMIEAAIQGNVHPSIVQNLIQQGNRAKSSQVSLASNSSYYNTEIIRTLLYYGARPTQEALLNTVGRNDAGMVNELLRYKAVPQLAHVQMAIKNNNKQMVMQLINASPVLMVESAELQYAVDQNDINLTNLFLERGANATPNLIAKAVSYGDQNMTKALLKSGEADQAALQAAAEINNVALFNLILESGVFLSNNNPINTAIDKNNTELVSLGLNHGGSPKETLNYAASKKNKGAMVLALEAGAIGTAALDFAVENKDSDFYISLLDRFNADPNNALAKTIANNNIEFGKHALNYSADPNKQIAATSAEGKMDWVSSLLEFGADPNLGIKGAVDKQHIPIVQKLIAFGADTNQASLMHSATRNKNLNLIKVLVEEGGADPEAGRTIAIGNNDLSILEYLLTQGAVPTGLKTPAQNGWVDMIQVLLNFGADPNEGIGESINADKTSAAVLLLDYGADTGNYIEVSAAKGNGTITAKLLENGADPNPGTLNAVRYKHVGILQQLIGYDADVSRATLMDIAVVNFQEEMIVLLLANGGDTKFRTKKGETYLHRVSDKRGQSRLVKIFVDAGMDLNAVDKDQETALHKAVRTGKKNVAAVKYLIDGGANVNAKDKRGRSVLRRANNKAAKELLEAAGAVK